MKYDTRSIILIFILILGGYTLFYTHSYTSITETFATYSSYADKYATDYKILKSDNLELRQGETKTVDLTAVEAPYTREPINSLDDYETNVIYMNESDKALSKELRDKLTSQRPMDWAGLPPSSSQFQAGLCCRHVLLRPRGAISTVASFFLHPVCIEHVSVDNE